MALFTLTVDSRPWWQVMHTKDGSGLDALLLIFFVPETLLLGNQTVPT